jgi:plastocyanin
MTTPCLRRRSQLRAVIVAVAVCALAGCGGGEGGSALPADPDVVIKAPRGRGLVFDMNAYRATAGDVGIAYQNDDVQTHTMVIEDTAGQRVAGFGRLVVGMQRTAGATVELAAGEYRIVCDIHLPTMVAGLTVTPPAP